MAVKRVSFRSAGCGMKLLKDFFKQQVPRTNGETITYYQQSMELNERMFGLYILLSFLLVTVTLKRFFWMPILVLGAVLIKHAYRRQISIRLNLLLHALIVLIWSAWYVRTFGWGQGGQHMLIVLVLLSFFSVYEPPLVKTLYFFGVLAARMALHGYAATRDPLVEILPQQSFWLQLLNSVTMLVLLAGCSIIYSSNLQETERKLLLHNEQLQHQAETDPLTKLFNRRYMMSEMKRFVQENPAEMYCVAIADIDFFKRVNDTYGHNCGDYVLCQLAALFMQKSIGQYSVARWGGEEFCFFIPGKNIDDAGALITDVCLSVKRMKLEFEEHCFSITLTAGVEESDYRSTLPELIERADHKLYMGKKNGRDQVVI